MDEIEEYVKVDLPQHLQERVDMSNSLTTSVDDNKIAEIEHGMTKVSGAEVIILFISAHVYHSPSATLQLFVFQAEYKFHAILP